MRPPLPRCIGMGLSLSARSVSDAVCCAFPASISQYNTVQQFLRPYKPKAQYIASIKQNVLILLGIATFKQPEYASVILKYRKLRGQCSQYALHSPHLILLLGPSMAHQPLVGVIIPAYNAEAHIDAALSSARAQTYAALDIIVVDDGSTDTTAERVAVHANDDARVRLLQQDNQGVAAARNRAIAATQASLIAPLDADDLWAPQKIARHVARLRTHPEAGLAYSWWVSLDEDGRVIGQSDRWGLEGDAFQALLSVNFVGNASVPVYRRDVLDEAGGYVSYRSEDAEGCEDWDLTLRVAERAPFCLVASYLTGYRSVSHSMSTRVDRMLRSYDRVIAPLRARHPEVPEEVYAWSRSNFMAYLGTLCYNHGAFTSAIRLLYASMRTDPPAVLCTTSLKKLLKSAIRRAAQPITRYVWPTQADWKAFRQHTTRKPPPLDLPPAAYPTLNDAVESWSWKPYKPYDRIRMQRWDQVVDASSSYTSSSPVSS